MCVLFFPFQTPGHLKKLFKTVKFIIKRFAQNTDYSKVILVYLNLIMQLKKRFISAENRNAIFHDSFCELTSVCGYVLKIPNLWKHPDFVDKFIKLWIELTRQIPNEVKLEALIANKDFL